MSKFVFSNNLEWYRDIRKRCEEVGFRISADLEADKYYFCVFKKLNFNNENYYSDDNDFVSCSGTLFYKKKFGKGALKMLLSDLKKKSIAEVRKELIGTYAVIAKINNRVIIFVDEMGLYALYYYQEKNEYVVTNTFYHIAKSIEGSINVSACMEELDEYSIYDNQTPICDVYRLLGDEIIDIDMTINKIELKRIRSDESIIDSKDFDYIIKNLKEKILDYSILQKLCGNSKVVFLTGGIDSRLQLACDLAVGIKPSLANWQSASSHMNTKKEDRIIMNKIAKKMHIASIEIDVSDGDDGIISERSFDKFGELALIYGNNSKWVDFFENSQYNYYDFGYYGEILQDLDFLNDNYKSPMSVERFSYVYMNRSQQTYVNVTDDYREGYYNYVLKKIKRMCEKNGFNQKDLSMEDCMVLYLYYRIHADDKCCNFVNYFGYSYNLLGQKEIVDIINQVPYEKRKKSHLSLELTRSLCPQLLDIEYYSHGVYKKYDSFSNTLVDDINNRVKIKKVLRKMLPKTIVKKYDSLKLAKNRNILNDNCEVDEINKLIEIYKRFDRGFLLQIDEKSFKYLPLYVSHASMQTMLFYLTK